MNSSPPNTSVTPFPNPDDEGPGYRVPPANTEAEQALLGAILVNNRAFERLSEFLRPEHFLDPRHGKIYQACASLIERGQIANPVTLKNIFDQDETFAEIGGSAYLARLAAAAITILNAQDYGRTIHDLYLRRQLIAFGEDTVNVAYDHDPETGALDQIEEAERTLYDLATTGNYEGGFKPFATALTNAIEMAEAAYKREGKLSGVATGLIDLDKLLGGLHKSDLVILAGRPSMGKTALATNVAFHAAKSYREARDEAGEVTPVDGAVIGFFSLEMSAEQLATRILAEEAGVTSEKIRRGELSDADFMRVVAASRTLATTPFFIDDTPALSVAALRTRARRLKRQHGLSMIVVDYLQLMSASKSARQENRVQEVSEITRGLKTLAKELDVPVLALSQLSRAVENREDKRPQLSDLRESGTIEQDADVVMFIFREEYYLERQEPIARGEETTEKFHERRQAWEVNVSRAANLAEIIVAKQRHGPTGTIKLRFFREITKFDNYSDADHIPDSEF